MEQVVKIGINDKGDRIWLQGPYALTYPSCKTIPGARWSKPNRVWTYPLSMITCRTMRSVYGERLQISANLSRWARSEVAREKHMTSRSKDMDAELLVVPTLAPRMSQAMSTRTYQKSGARFIAEGGSVALFDEPGLGKTITSLAGLMESGLWRAGSKHLVIGPKTAVQSTWPDELEKWTTEAGVQIFSIPSTDNKNKRVQMLAEALEPSETPTFVLINPNMLQVKEDQWCEICEDWEVNVEDDFAGHVMEQHKTKNAISKMDYPGLFETTWDSVIADECHKYMLKLRPKQGDAKMPQWAKGLLRLKIAADGLRIPMTGTPFRGKEYNMFGILHWARPKEYSSFWNFVDNFLEKGDNGFGVVLGGLREDEVTQREFDLAMSKTCLRRSRHEVRSELPSQVIIDHWVPMSPKQKKQYEEYAEMGSVTVESGEIESLGALSEITRLRQFSFGVWDVSAEDKPFPVPGESPKVDLLIDILDERGLNAESEKERKAGKGDPEALKYIVVSQFAGTVLKAVEEQLEKAGLGCLHITGQAKNRRETVKDFSSPGGARILLLSTTAGGESITLDAYCEEMIILDETHVEDDMVQVRGRIDNRGDKIASRLYHYIRTRDTIEEDLMKKNIIQENMQLTLLDERRGVATAKRVVPE